MNSADTTDAPLTGRPNLAAGRWSRHYEFLLFAAIIALAVSFRVAKLDSTPFWVDEAESSINALTILQHGYPTDTYLGQPIYENVLLKRWPESREYEFRDLSYSDRHVAIYHGWLPLYAIAGSFALQGIRPDLPTKEQTWSIKHDLAEQKRRTRAARLPAVIFGVLFLVTVFIGGKALYGNDAGWIALIVGSIHPWHLEFSRQARYYSAEITFTTACCVLLWLLIQKCTWKRACAAAVAFILLFHTHLLSFVTAAVVFAIVTPWILQRNRRALPKLLACGVIIVAGTLPWLIFTGFLQEQGRIPRAWSLLEFPVDFLRYPPLTGTNVVLGCLILILVILVMLYRTRIALRLSAPVLRLAPVLLFLSIWGVCGYLCFLLFMPAVSFAAARVNLSYWGPLFLLEAAIYATLARVLVPRIPAVVGASMMLLILWGSAGTTIMRVPGSDQHWEKTEAIFQGIDDMRLSGNARIYATPNDDLIFTFYSGFPVQDITPVRRSFLNSYPGDIVYIEPGLSIETGMLTPQRVRAAALQSGLCLSPAECERWSKLLMTRDARAAVLATVGPTTAPKLEALPVFAQQLLNVHHCRVSCLLSTSDYGFLIRGFMIRTWSDWRNVLKYRFVNPVAHWGPRANYAERFRGAEVITLPEIDTVLYRSKWHSSYTSTRAGSHNSDLGGAAVRAVTTDGHGAK